MYYALEKSESETIVFARNECKFAPVKSRIFRLIFSTFEKMIWFVRVFAVVHIILLLYSFNRYPAYIGNTFCILSLSKF